MSVFSRNSSDQLAEMDVLSGASFAHNERLNAMTEGRGPDRCIDAVGCEAHGTGGVDAILDNVKATVKLATDRADRHTSSVMRNRYWKRSKLVKSIRHSSSLIAFHLRKRQPLTRPSVTRKMGALKSYGSPRASERACLTIVD
jgi:hypothetical protein